MTVYYWESVSNSGRFYAENDVEAKKHKGILQKESTILICYKESNTPDGTPFIEI